MVLVELHPETVWVVMIEHKYGFDHWVHLSKEGAVKTLVCFITEWWDESYGEKPEDDWDLICQYFDNVEEEWYIMDEITLED